MDTRETCGYKGHYCSPGVVRFISRYRFVNDYCVGGKRVSVEDTGHVSANATDDDLRAILSFERAKYTEYLEWHAQSPITQAATPLPFDAGISRARIATMFHAYIGELRGGKVKITSDRDCLSPELIRFDERVFASVNDMLTCAMGYRARGYQVCVDTEGIFQDYR